MSRETAEHVTFAKPLNHLSLPLKSRFVLYFEAIQLNQFHKTLLKSEAPLTDFTMLSTLIAPLTFLTLLPSALAHGHQVPMSDDADWATRHMAGKTILLPPIGYFR